MRSVFNNPMSWHCVKTGKEKRGFPIIFQRVVVRTTTLWRLDFSINKFLFYSKVTSKKCRKLCTFRLDYQINDMNTATQNFIKRGNMPNIASHN